MLTIQEYNLTYPVVPTPVGIDAVNKKFQADIGSRDNLIKMFEPPPVSDSVLLAKGLILPRGTILGVGQDGLYRLCVKTATDGSQFPSAVLSDTVNSTGSIITIGIYISGLFNSERIVYDNSWGRKSLLDFLKQYRIYVE